MKNRNLSLRDLLSKKHFPKADSKLAAEQIRKLQLRLLRAQQGIWHSKGRALILFEGFDAAGKGGAIRRLVEPLDPRGVRACAFGPPLPEEQEQHYLQRFWRELPFAGNITIFDRTWYGRVLVERVQKLVAKRRWQEAYEEINDLEKILTNDGIAIIKIFLAISEKEQLARFEQRLKDPYKQWKLTPADIEARTEWEDYVLATDDMFKNTNTKIAPWHLIAANDKDYARIKVLEIVTETLRPHSTWMEEQVLSHEAIELTKALKQAQKISK
jgi:polyphosphate kinase 2 (PPK2 family)